MLSVFMSIYFKICIVLCRQLSVPFISPSTLLSAFTISQYTSRFLTLIIYYNVVFPNHFFKHLFYLGFLPFPSSSHCTGLSPPVFGLDQHRNLLTGLTSIFIPSPSIHSCQVNFLKCKSNHVFPGFNLQ